MKMTSVSCLLIMHSKRQSLECFDSKRGFLRFLDERKQSSGAKYGSQFSETFGKIYNQSMYSGNYLNETSRTHGCAHENCITIIVPLKKAGNTTVTSFNTAEGVINGI